jgi:hypothetical protein
MLFISSVLTAFCFCAPSMSLPPEWDRLRVNINLALDHSITSKAMATIAKREATAIWKPYGVDLVWADAGTQAALSLEVIVEPRPLRIDPGGTQAVLGHTIIFSSEAVPSPIRVSLTAIESLLERQHSANPLLQEIVLATALGRVMAHEVGHVLLGVPGFHDPQGLMRTTFVPDDLARMERSQFGLTDRSIARLRARIASLSQAPPSESCARPIGVVPWPRGSVTAAPATPLDDYIRR